MKLLSPTICGPNADFLEYFIIKVNVLQTLACRTDRSRQAVNHLLITRSLFVDTAGNRRFKSELRDSLGYVTVSPEEEFHDRRS